MILGSLLGDASIGKPLGEQYQKANARIQLVHSIKQKPYVEWKYEILKNIVLAPPSIRSVMSGKNRGFIKDEYMAFGFATRCLPCVTEIFNLMGTREITQKWLDEITDPIALAVWYMDDGCLAVDRKYEKLRYSIRFCVGDRNLHELELLKSWMNTRFGLDYVRIYIPPNRPTKRELQILHFQTVKKFENIVRPHILPSMQYKMPPEDRPLCKYRTPKHTI